MTTTQRETLAEYHADTSALTNSAKEKFIESPALYRGLYVTRTIPFAPSTPSQVLGSITHCLLLEPERFTEEYTVAPQSCRARSGKAWMATVDEAEQTGTTPILAGHLETARKMADAVKTHENAWKLLYSPHGEAETPIRWTDPMTGMACKCRPDWLIDHEKLATAVCVDLKTAADPGPEDFGKSAANFGYHRQAAWYSDGIVATIGKPVRWLWVVVGNDEPFDVWVYSIGIEDAELGRVQNRKAMMALAIAIETDAWLAPGQAEIQTLELPRWARRNDE